MSSNMVFSPQPPLSPQSMLTQCLNDATGYLNAIILTPRLNAALYERIANGLNNGHYIAVLYFSTVIKDEESEKIYELLTEGNVPCFRINEETLVDNENEAA
jgi:hypothetical protein